MRLHKEWLKVHQMTEQQLDTYAGEHRVQLTTDFENLKAAADAICRELGIDEPEGHAGEALDKEVQQHMRKHNCTYTEALSKLASDPDFLRRWEVIFQ
jgi:hypothetical protein